MAKAKLFVVDLLFYFVIFCGTVVRCTIEPVLVQVLFRHGDRSSVDTYPNNQYTEEDWPQGYGQLSQAGMMQHYTLGNFFRERYILGNPYKLLEEKYSRYQMRIQSTDYDRTLMSAYCHLAGMYPPSGNQQWNHNITWQPVPVHTEPTDIDHLLYVDSNCPRYDQLFNESLKSDVVQKEEKQNKYLYDFIAMNSGVSKESIANIWMIFDTLHCEARHPELGFKLPDWANSTVMDKLQELESFSFSLKYNTTEMKRLRGGSLVGQMLRNMDDKLQANLTDPTAKKYFIYSAHDTTVAAFLGALDVFNHIFPPYTATAVMELLNDTETSSYFVRVLYKNDSAQPHELTIPGCDVLCPLEKFRDLVQPVIPVHWESECGLGGGHPITRNELYMIIVISVVGLVLIVAFALGILTWYRKKNGSQHGRYSSLSVTS